MVKNSKPLIMIVEDDEETARLNKRMLMRRGYDVQTAFNAGQARMYIREHRPDLIVLDIILPDGCGLALCKEFRLNHDIPILFLTGKKSIQDRVAGLIGGGDYYLTKPYSVEELVAVVERLLVRTAQTQEKIDEASVIKRGSLTLKIPQSLALVNGRDIGLTNKEFAVLLLLVQNQGVMLKSEAIYKSIWNTPMNKDSTALRVQMTRMKKKLNEENTDDFTIIYVQGKGYMFTMD